MIGGEGKDHLGGGPGDDILIAGFTDHDDDFDALCAIMDEWTSDREYEVRVRNLRDGTGSADRENEVYFLNALTVHDDAEDSEDRLTGASARDWFFARPEEDRINGEKKDEEVTDTPL